MRVVRLRLGATGIDGKTSSWLIVEPSALQSLEEIIIGSVVHNAVESNGANSTLEIFSSSSV